MPIYTVELMQDSLNEAGLAMKNTVIGIMGISYKANVDDQRESPTFKIVKELEKKKAKIIKFDPYVLDQSDVKDLKTFLSYVIAL